VTLRAVSKLIGIFHIGIFCFRVPFLKQLLLRNCAVDFVEICNVYIGKIIIIADKRIFNPDKIYRSYSDLNFGIAFLEHSVVRSTLLSEVGATNLPPRKNVRGKFVESSTAQVWHCNDYFVANFVLSLAVKEF